MRIDTAMQLYQTASSDTQKLTALLKLFDEHQSLNRDTMDAYAPVLHALAYKIGDERSRMLAELAYGNWYFRWGWTDSALVFVEPLLKECRPENEAYRDLYFLLIRARALYYTGTSRYADALKSLYETVAAAEKYRDTVALGLAMNTIGSVAMARQQHEEAKEWIHKAIQIATKGSFRMEVAVPAYLNAALWHTARENIDSANHFINLALPLCVQFQLIHYHAHALRIQSQILVKQRRYEAAEKAIRQMMALRYKLNSSSILVEDNLQLASFYAESGQLDKAIDVCKSNLKRGPLENTDSLLAGSVFTNDPKVRITYLEALALYQKQANYMNDYAETLEEIVAVKDTFYQANSAQAIADVQTKYEVQKKEALIASQRLSLFKQNVLTGVLAGIAVVGAFLAWLIIRQNRKREADKMRLALERQKELAEQQVKLAEEQERRRIAADLHDNLGAYASSIASSVGYLRSQSDSRHEASAIGELQHNAHMIISQLKDTIWALKKDSLTLTEISDRLKIFLGPITRSHPQLNLEVEEQLQSDVQLTASQAFHLYRILQEGITNALKHSQGSRIGIYFQATTGWQVMVEDDGVDTEEWMQKEHPGSGIANIRQRAAECGWIVLWQPRPQGGTRMIIKGNTN